MYILQLAVRAPSGEVLLPEGARRCPAMRWKVEVANFRLRPLSCGWEDIARAAQRLESRLLFPKLLTAQQEVLL